MKTFFEKLDDMAARLLNTVDNDLQQPITAVITGEVFKHDTSIKTNDNTVRAAQPVQKPVVPAAAPAREPKTSSSVRQPILRKAR